MMGYGWLNFRKDATIKSKSGQLFLPHQVGQSKLFQMSMGVCVSRASDAPKRKLPRKNQGSLR
jgi:hypothetical protein